MESVHEGLAESIPQRRAFGLWQEMRQGGEVSYDRALDLAYCEMADRHRREWQALIDTYHPTPEFCGECGEWVSTDDYLTEHLAHGTDDEDYR